MFEQAFKDVLSNLTTDELLIDKMWKEIKSNYSSSRRFYHTLTHLDNLVEELLPVKNQIEDWQTVILSVAYHDIIYNPLKKDNEERSAALAYDRLTQLGLPENQKEKCRQQIVSTKMHEANDNSDTNYFTDADLSILGSDPNSYFKYAGQIRKEYRYFPDVLYKPGRKKVLMEFLKMKSIFKTKYFRDRYEEQAKINISDELKSLS